MQFSESLASDDIKKVRKIPKSDLHNHAMMGGRLSHLEKAVGKKIERFRNGAEGIHGINKWIAHHYRDLLLLPGTFEKAIEGAFLQAKSDGITVLEMSMDVFMPRLFNIPPETVISTLKQKHAEIAPEIDFRPELGMARSLPVRQLLSCIEPFLESGYFRSIDLYDDEFAQPIGNFREIYRFAKETGLRCKAHAGEFGDAESVRNAVEVLDLDAVQHGIGASTSVEVMKWLAKNNIQLNVCPASNISLRRVKSYKSHPIRTLFDHGVKVTVNSDDLMLFNKGNSEQFLLLYRSGSFSSEELDLIRMNGISASINS